MFTYLLILLHNNVCIVSDFNILTDPSLFWPEILVSFNKNFRRNSSLSKENLIIFPICVSEPRSDVLSKVSVWSNFFYQFLQEFPSSKVTPIIRFYSLIYLLWDIYQYKSFTRVVLTASGRNGSLSKGP